jgi:hypothetical protein
MPPGAVCLDVGTDRDALLGRQRDRARSLTPPPASPQGLDSQQGRRQGTGDGGARRDPGRDDHRGRGREVTRMRASADRLGSVGKFHREDMAPIFNAAAFALRVGR